MNVTVAINDNFLAEFDKRVDRAGSCHHWIGATTNGLPSFRGRLATRVAYEIANGRAVPPGRHVRRRCSAPLCVRPEHLTIDVHERVKRPRRQQKLSRMLADDVRARHAAGAAVMQLAADFAITRQHVYRIVSGQAWVGDPGTRQRQPGTALIERVAVDPDGTSWDVLACGHGRVRSTPWPNTWRRCDVCASEAVQA